MNIGQTVKIKTKKGGHRKATIIGIIQSFHADEACLVEYLNGDTEQLPNKYIKGV